MALKSKTTSIVFRRDPTYGKCPGCGKYNTLRRSRTRNIRESILKLTTIYKVYRCRDCGWRGFLSTLTITSQTFKNLLIYIGLAVLTAIIIMQVLPRIAR